MSIAHRRRLGALLVAGAMIGCGGGSAPPSLLVFAAASLTDALDAVVEGFEAAHPGVEVDVSYAASSALREQILEGAPADVFAAASEETMAAVFDAGLVADVPLVFALNDLVIAVPRDDPNGVFSLEDLARADLLIGLCAPQVPCGSYARMVLAEAGVTAAVDTDEPDVRALVTKLERRELDAGLVYRSDAVASDLLEYREIPSQLGVEARYLIAVLGRSRYPDAAQSFVAYVLSDSGRTILADGGFEVP